MTSLSGELNSTFYFFLYSVESVLLVNINPDSRNSQDQTWNWQQSFGALMCAAFDTTPTLLGLHFQSWKALSLCLGNMGLLSCSLCALNISDEICSWCCCHIVPELNLVTISEFESWVQISLIEFWNYTFYTVVSIMKHRDSKNSFYSTQLWRLSVTAISKVFIPYQLPAGRCVNVDE